MKKPEIETITFSDGATVVNKTYQLGNGIVLKVHSEKEGVLTIDNGYLEFAWNRCTFNAFHSLETITGAELLTAIAVNPL